MKRTLSLIGALTACTLSALVMTGCEEAGSPVRSLTVTPSSATITEANGAVTFAVAGGDTNANPTVYGPLAWSVSDPSRGTISASGGFTAVYKRNGNSAGSNAVIVRDRLGSEGVATINQSTPSATTE